MAKKVSKKKVTKKSSSRKKYPNTVFEDLGGDCVRMTVSVSQKVSDGDYGSISASAGLSLDLNKKSDIDGLYTKTFEYLDNVVLEEIAGRMK